MTLSHSAPDGVYNSYCFDTHNGGNGFLFPAASASSFSSSRPLRRPKSSICSRTVRPGVSSLSSQGCVSCFSSSMFAALAGLEKIIINSSFLSYWLFNEVSVAAPAGNSPPLQSLGARMPSADHPTRPRQKKKHTQLIECPCMGLHEPVPRKLPQIFYDPFWRLLASPNRMSKKNCFKINFLTKKKPINQSPNTFHSLAQCLPLRGATARQSTGLQFLATQKGATGYRSNLKPPKKCTMFQANLPQNDHNICIVWSSQEG